MVIDVNGAGVEASQEEGGTTSTINIDCQVSDAAELKTYITTRPSSTISFSLLPLPLPSYIVLNFHTPI